MTPIERAARALILAQFMATDEPDVAEIEHCVPFVRAVLQAIREPSENMALAGEMAGDAAAYPVGVGIETFGDEAELGHYGALSVWQAMIDAALSE